jgi:hypothetical protein
MILGQGLGLGYAYATGGGGGSPPPALLMTGLVSYIDADAGLTLGAGSVVSQAVGVATCVEGAAGEGPAYDSLGWGRTFHLGGNAGVAPALQFNGGDWLTTTDAAVLATFGATTTDYTVLALLWTHTPASNQYVWGIGNTSNNRSLSGQLPTGQAYIQTVGSGIGGTGTVSTSGLWSAFTRNRFPMIAVWRQEGSRHRIYINKMDVPVLDTTFTWATNPTHTRFGWGCLPDLSPNNGQSGGMLKFAALYNRSLSDQELSDMGRYCGMRANHPIGGWTLDEVSWL